MDDIYIWRTVGSLPWSIEARGFNLPLSELRGQARIATVIVS